MPFFKNILPESVTKILPNLEYPALTSADFEKNVGVFGLFSTDSFGKTAQKKTFSPTFASEGSTLPQGKCIQVLSLVSAHQCDLR